jgi:cysteine desulfurase / selenocysteine lyase
VVRRQNTLLDFTKRNLADINRASVHYYNNDDEIERFCDALTESIRSA